MPYPFSSIGDASHPKNAEGKRPRELVEEDSDAEKGFSFRIPNARAPAQKTTCSCASLLPECRTKKRPRQLPEVVAPPAPLGGRHWQRASLTHTPASLPTLALARPCPCSHSCRPVNKRGALPRSPRNRGRDLSSRTASRLAARPPPWWSPCCSPGWVAACRLCRVPAKPSHALPMQWLVVSVECR